ncbi:putative ABC transport system permease protein [Micromonospora matsumotoense]|uniref:Putative ABC transport system permease protein n=1 Tax=Micromonospora matsumotoense TaxID=121616 RepID=A0A1C5A053_9ACTN|nr:FtsX-like permease family protein [Micromonospora matsumotoense]SCF38632.1 putative ABC transport system permease protein [Micromonospora matsumotoense]
MSIGAVIRRVRAHSGQFLLLAALTLVIALLVGGVPRVVNRLADQGLREHLAAEPAARRDLTYATRPGVGAPPVSSQAAELDALQQRMPADVRAAVAQRWYAAQTPEDRVTGPDLARGNYLVHLGLRAMPGVEAAGTLVEGRWPDEAAAADAPVQVALAADIAGRFGLRVGSRLLLAPPDEEHPPTPLTVVGLFRPVDPTDGSWDTLPSVLEVAEPEGDGQPFILVGLVSVAALDRQAVEDRPVSFTWRYRLGADGIDVRRIDQLVDGVQRLARASTGTGTELTQGVDVPLREFGRAVTSARTLLAVIGAGVLATLAGLVVLAAALTVRRRRTEFVLIRARGGGVTTGVRRSLAESLLVVPPAAGLGWLLGGLLPGAPGGTGPLAVGATALVTLALPVATLVVPSGVVGRRDLGRLRPSARRATTEAALVLLAGLAVVLLRRRGLTPGSVDPLLVSVPALVAVAASVLALRLYPWPVRLAGRLAARTRGSVAFLGTARAGRAAAATPLVVVVLAVATAAFCAVIATGIEATRDDVATRAVPADALIRGDRLAPDTGPALERLPGVRAATGLADESAQRLATDADGTDARLRDTSVLLVDGPGLARTARAAGRDVPVPGPLRDARPGAGPLPAVVSPAVAADLADAGLRSAFITVQGQRYEFTPVDTVVDFPLARPNTTRYVVLPWQALPRRDSPPVPTGFLVAGDRLDAGALRQAGDEGQHRYQTGGAVTGRERPRGVAVETWSQTRLRLGGGGANGLLAFGFTAGAVAGGVLALLAIAFTVLAGARARGEVLSRLRTLGLSRRQWRGLLLVELAPLVGVSVLTGALVGVLLPVLLTPLLGLAAFTSGTPVRVGFAPGLVAATVGLGAVALGFAMAVEALNNRRMRLGEVLRLGEES